MEKHWQYFLGIAITQQSCDLSTLLLAPCGWEQISGIAELIQQTMTEKTTWRKCWPTWLITRPVSLVWLVLTYVFFCPMINIIPLSWLFYFLFLCMMESALRSAFFHIILNAMGNYPMLVIFLQIPAQLLLHMKYCHMKTFSPLILLLTES